MKVLHLIQKKQLRGAEIFAAQLASHMKQSGHEVLIFSLFDGQQQLPFDGPVISLSKRSHRRLFDFSIWKSIARNIQKENPDIIQANAGDTLKYAVVSKLLFRWKQPIVFRNASTISLYIKSNISKKLNSLFFSRVEKVISVSQTSAADFADLFPEYKNRIISIPVGIEEESQVEQTVSPGTGNKNERDPILIHVGGFSFEKNHTGLINIFERILEKRKTAMLHLVGDGPLKAKIEDLVKQKGLESNIRFFGFRTDSVKLIKEADVLMLPSIIEGLPAVILESFYSRTPVVANDVGGIKEILINNKTGRLIKKGNDQEFADSVIQSLENNIQNQNLIDNAYALASSGYLNKHIARQFLNSYESILK